MTIAVFYNDHMVGAVACNGDVILEPHIDALDRDHPDRRWATGLATFARRVQTGDDPGPYSDQGACAFARALLLPVHQFAPLTARSDLSLAAYFRVPVEQVRAQRADLGLTWN